MEIARRHESFDAVRAARRPYTEGGVVHWPHNALRVKLKTPDYAAAARCMQYVSPRRILELMAEGRDDDVLAQLPAHVRETFVEVREDLACQIGDLKQSADLAYHYRRHYLDGDPSNPVIQARRRKRFAESVNDADIAKDAKALVFASQRPRGRRAGRSSTTGRRR